MPQAELSDSCALCHVCVSANKTDRWRSEMEIMPEAARMCSENECWSAKDEGTSCVNHRLCVWGGVGGINGLRCFYFTSF